MTRAGISVFFFDRARINAVSNEKASAANLTRNASVFLDMCREKEQMTETKPLTPSEQCARSLLAAWNRGDLATLQARMDMGFPSESGITSFEEERIELVQEIASTIRLWLLGMRRRNSADMDASLRLLRYLARCEGSEEDMQNGSSTEAARSGTLAFVRN